MDATVSAENEAEVERILDIVMGATRVEVQQAAELLVSKSNREFFGESEFLVRDAVHRIGTRLIDAALEERKKKG